MNTKTVTVWRKIQLDTVRLAALLRRVANRPWLSRSAGYSADEMERELQWRAEHAAQSVAGA